jgi:hypothetical protein
MGEEVFAWYMQIVKPRSRGYWLLGRINGGCSYEPCFLQSCQATVS